MASSRRHGAAGDTPRRPVVMSSVAPIVVLLVALLGAVAVATSAVSGAAVSSAAVGRVAKAPATPILSVRRLPDWIEDGVGDERLAAGLPAVLAPLGAAAASSCLIVARAGRTLYASHPDEELLPASNMKVLTAIAVLDRLGPAARLRTVVTTVRRPVHGVVDGDLYLVGGGDPLLWTSAYDARQLPAQPLYTPLAALAARVRAAGVTSIDGRVVGDESLFDTRRAVPTWEPSYTAEADVGPLSALEVDSGFGSTPPYGAASRPALMAAGVFTALLRADGVAVVGGDGVGRSPRRAVTLSSVASAPLAAVVGAVLRVSDDTGAELLVKQLGARAAHTGTTAAGVAALRADLAADGLPVGELHAADGSGLDRGDRVSCRLMIDALERSGTHGAVFAGLAVAGRTGTLATRMVGTPAVGRLHAKTGTLNDVSALSGFVLAAPAPNAATAYLGAPVTFSFISNGIHGAQGVAVGNRLGAYLATGVALPPLADAAPA